jgi:hypothetical protein
MFADGASIAGKDYPQKSEENGKSLWRQTSQCG